MGNQPVRVAILGTGRISDLHAIEYKQNPKGKIVALCDQNVKQAQSQAEAWGVDDPIISDDYREILARPDVDLVEILLPHHLHLQAALDAIAAGKMVSLQKPMCMNMDEADILVEAAESYDRPFKIFENFIFHPPVLKAKELVDAGAIGDPISIRIKSNPGKSKTAWKVPAAANAWRQMKDMAGGGPLVFDDGHHKFALAWHFMGMPSDVHAFIGQTEVFKGIYLDAPSMVSFRFPGNKIGNLEVVYSPELEIATKHYAQDDRVEITGTQGVLWINCGHGSIGNPAPLIHYREGNVTEYRDIYAGWEQSFVNSTRHYLDAITEGGDPILTARQGRDVLKFALAAEDSARTGQTISF